MFPAEALSRELAARGWRVVLATDHRGEQYAANFPAEEKLYLDTATGSGPVALLKAGWRSPGACCRRARPSSGWTRAWWSASAAIRRRRPCSPR
jgi:UDP-N-acetylglucosamine:LPS N-acetylglucosamine transferase